MPPKQPWDWDMDPLPESTHVSEASPEWDLMWAALAVTERGASDPTVRRNPESGECWQYMGTSFRGRTSGSHCFRHRDHPDTGDRVYRNIAASASFVADFHKRKETKS